jgi:signal transduction histidine kinase
MGWHKLVFLSACFLFSGQVVAQLKIDSANYSTWYNLNSKLQVYSTPDTSNANAVMGAIASGQLRKLNIGSSAGFSNKVYWIHFSIDLSLPGLEYFLVLDNPHLDIVKLYRVFDQDSLKLLSSTGDRRPFRTRQVLNRSFVFDPGIEYSIHNEYLLMVQKPSASVSFPLELWIKRDFLESELESNLASGMYFGILLIIALFSLLSGARMFDKLFLSYGVYVTFMMLYAFTHLGFSFEFLYPQSAIANNYVRALMVFFILASASDFFRRFLNVGRFIPWLDRFYKLIIALGAAIAILWSVSNAVFDLEFRYLGWYLNFNYALIIILITSLFYVLIATFNDQKGPVSIFWAALVAVGLGGVFNVLIEYGVMTEKQFAINPFIAGSMIETVIFLFAMIYQVQKLYRNNREYVQQLQDQQKELVRAFVEGGENERKRVSADLHDTLGSNLAILKKKVVRKLDDPEIREDFDHICEEVREISNRMVPSDLQLLGFQKSIENLVANYRKLQSFAIDLNMHDLPSLPPDMALQLYRVIQEALQNIEKHAQAAHVDIQVIGHESEVIITVDDDGQGFKLHDRTSGDGFFNMKARVGSLGGELDISSSPGAGTHLVISVPFSLTQSG